MVIQHLYTKFDIDMIFCFEVSNGAMNHVAQSTSIQTRMSYHLVRVHWTLKVSEVCLKTVRNYQYTGQSRFWKEDF